MKLKNRFWLTLLLILIQGCTQQETWYRGNTHAHTVLCGHADATPDSVARWYLDRGYHFLILSEHNRFIDPDSVNLPENRRADFILIPGEEVSGKKIIHTTAMNIRGLVDWQHDSEHKSEIIQAHVDSTRAAGGQAILNHPNFHYAVSAADIRPVEQLYLFELFNGHPLVNNFGDSAHISTEAMWDSLLTDGMRIYAVSSDDAHHFHEWSEEHSNPGRGWVMVKAPELTPDAITAAMLAGDFYASSGVFLKRLEITEKQYLVEIDTARTEAEINGGFVSGHAVNVPELLMDIAFIGPGGEVLKSVAGTSADYPLDGVNGYIRAKITWYHRHPDRGWEAFYAWCQPAFAE